MANEITLTLKMEYLDSSISDSMELDAISVTVLGTGVLHATQVTTASEAAITGFSALDSAGWMIAINRHASDSIGIRSGTGATNLITIPPGEGCCFKVDTAATAPFVIGTANEPILEYMIIEA